MVGLEEERLSHRQDVKAAATTRTPEVDLVQIRTASEEPVPRTIGHPHVRLHDWQFPPQRGSRQRTDGAAPKLFRDEALGEPSGVQLGGDLLGRLPGRISC
jgi:hypothetical protein